MEKFNAEAKQLAEMQNEYTLLTRFDEYYEPALIKDLRVQYVTEDTMAVLAMQSGELDVTRTWDAITAELDKTEGVTVYRFPETRVDMLWFNVSECGSLCPQSVRLPLQCRRDLQFRLRRDGRSLSFFLLSQFRVL